MQNKNLFERLSAIDSTMSASHRKISSFLLTNGHRTAFLTAAEIASAVTVSESTVVRFARVLGFKGFPELQEFLRGNLLETLSPADRFNTYEGIPDEKRLVDQVFELERLNLRAAQDYLDIHALHAIAQRTCNARRCYVVGLRSSRAPALLLGHHLKKILPQAITITSSDFMFEELSWITEQDFLIAFSFPRYSEQTIEALRIAHSASTPTGSVTDSTSSPAAQLSDHCLVTPVSSSFFGNSMVAATAIVNLLITLCIRQQPDTARANLTRVESAAAQDKRFIDAPKGGTR